MGVFIRIDVDKPYGHKNLLVKVLSKINENFFTVVFPKIYLRGLGNLITYLNEQEIQANVYFRNCTIPNSKLKELLKKGNHSIGFHAENTKNKEGFTQELNTFKRKIGVPITHFTKHGSGQLKLGKNHYPVYEPEKYLKWAKEMNLLYRFGNSTLEQEIVKDKDFISEMFWGESWYRKTTFNSIDTFVEASKKNDYVFLIHPSNYETHASVEKEFNYFIQQLKDTNIAIKTL
jgi:hypothetical protein